MRFPWRLRRPTLPDDAATALALDPRERVLAWSALAGGGFAVATLEGLRMITPHGRRVARPWTEIDHAAWDPDARTIAVWFVGSRATVPLEVEDGTWLAQVLRDRVDASVLLTTEIGLAGGGTLRLALRRRPDGTVVDQVVPPPGTDPDDPALAPLVRQGLAALRGEAGLDGGPAGPGLAEKGPVAW
jgi:hypothetical protein